MSRELRKAEIGVRKAAGLVIIRAEALCALSMGALGVPMAVDTLSTANQNLLSAISTYNDIADG